MEHGKQGASALKRGLFIVRAAVDVVLTEQQWDR
jgi:hypothetical protein